MEGEQRQARHPVHASLLIHGLCVFNFPLQLLPCGLMCRVLSAIVKQRDSELPVVARRSPMQPAWCLGEAVCASKHQASCKTPRRDHPGNAGPAVASNRAICPSTNAKQRQEKACAIQVSASRCPVNKAALLVPAKPAIPCYISTLKGCIHRIPNQEHLALPAWISSHFLYKSTTLHPNYSFTSHTHSRIYLFSLPVSLRFFFFK